jgi:superoxide dismutase, Fe-Mn family
MGNNRREFLKISGLLGLSGLAGSMLGNQSADQLDGFSLLLNQTKEKFTLPQLPYAYDALEPFIDKQTMEIHHGKHHQGYIDKLNTVPPGEIDFRMDDAAKCADVNQTTSALIRNNLGGYYNHALFWQMLKPNPKAAVNLPEGKLKEAIHKNFKNYDSFKKEFTDKALKVFGSGWCWLIVNSKNELKITSTANQDNPLMQVVSERGTPILCLDVWEHAYYLKYQNKRSDYITAWWSLVNWEKVQELYNKA